MTVSDGLWDTILFLFGHICFAQSIPFFNFFHLHFRVIFGLHGDCTKPGCFQLLSACTYALSLKTYIIFWFLFSNKAPKSRTKYYWISPGRYGKSVSRLLHTCMIDNEPLQRLAHGGMVRVLSRLLHTYMIDNEPLQGLALEGMVRVWVNCYIHAW